MKIMKLITMNQKNHQVNHHKHHKHNINIINTINNLPVIQLELGHLGSWASAWANQVVELFPGLLETLREPAMLLYDMMYFTSQAISWSLGRTWVEV